MNTTIHGINVIGGTKEIPALVKTRHLDRVIITIANASSKDIRQIVEICEAIPVPVKIVPGMFEILNGKVTVNRLRDVSIDDLLGREVVSFDQVSGRVGENFRGKRILVTGAGGSIGNEICRQLGAFTPSELVLLDQDENGLYEIDSDLRFICPHVVRKVVVCDIRNKDYLSLIFNSHRPQVIFHAAAYKHVPLMEENVLEAVTNNIQGTLNLLNLARRNNAERFVMLSTDKAVNPTSIMGAVKRVGELMIQGSASERTLFSCVRFGNVLGSRGSVVPLLQSQIRRGGPVTITDERATRFFMTIPEAAHLVTQAATVGTRGEIYVLDMGMPIKVVDLALDLIRLSGLSEDAIEVKYTGLRRGEKLHEELFYSYERASPTIFPKIVSVSPVEIDYAKFWERLEALLEICRSMESEVLRESVFKLISDATPVDAAPLQRESTRPIRTIRGGKTGSNLSRAESTLD